MSGERAVPRGSLRDDRAVTTAHDGTVIPDPYGPAAGSTEWLAEQHEQFEHLLSRVPLEWFRSRISELRRYVRNSPRVSRGGRSFFTRSIPGQGVRLMVCDARGAERVVIDGFRPSLVYPDIYPNGWAPSPDGDHIAYVHDASAEEDSAVLRVVATDALDGTNPVLEIPHARRATFAWVGHDLVCSLQGEQAIDHDLFVFRRDGDRFALAEPMTSLRAGVPRTRHELYEVPGTRQVLVSASDYSLGQPNQLALVNVDTGDTRVIQQETDVLTRVEVDAHGRWAYLLEYGGDSARRGALFRVPLDGDGPLTRGHWQTLVPESDAAVLRQSHIIDRGRDREPLVALHDRVHGVGRLFLADPETGSTWQVPLPAPAVEGGVEGGFHGVLSAITSATDNYGEPVLYVEHESLANPPRTWAVPTHPGAQPRLAQGMSDEELQSLGWPRVRARLHQFPAHDDAATPTWALELSPADAPDAPRPVTIHVYSGFFIAGENHQRYSPREAALSASGVTLFFPFARDGSEGARDRQRGATVNRGNAAAAVTAAAAHAREHIAGDQKIVLYAASQGPLIALMALRNQPLSFDAAVLERGASDIIASTSEESVAEYCGSFSPEEMRAAYDDSAGYHEAPGTPFPDTVFVADDRDPRVPAVGVRKAHAAMWDTTSRGEIYLARTSEGHFVGADAQASTASLIAELSASPHRSHSDVAAESRASMYAEATPAPSRVGEPNPSTPRQTSVNTHEAPPVPQRINPVSLPPPQGQPRAPSLGLAQERGL